MKKLVWSILFTSIFFTTWAQIQIPAASPAGSVSTTVGLTDIKIDYFRPRIKGRTIFANDPKALIPYGTIWRTGANSGTKISFSDDVSVEGTAVPKGEYLIFTWPGEKEWSISLYKDISLGGNTGKYDEKQEAAKFKIKPEKLTEKVETLTFQIGDLSDDNTSAKVQLAWENTSVKFTVKVDFDTKVMEAIKANTKVNPSSYYQAAVYYLETGKDLKQALEWINASNPGTYWMLYQKALIQKGLGDKKGATETAKASLEAAKKANNRDYERMNEDLIKSLK